MRPRLVPRFVVTTLVLACAATSLAREARADDPATTADTEPKDRSRAAFRKGVAQLRAQDWAAARASFETAWSLYPHPSILLNLGIARLHTGDPVRAEQDLVRFLSEDVGASADELASAREALADVRTRIGTLRIVVSPPSARVAVDGKAVETVRAADPGATSVVAEVRAKPGRHAVVVTAEGYEPVKRDVDVAARGEVASVFALAPVDTVKQPPAESGISTRAVVGWSLVGLAAPALITSAVSAVRAKALSDEYDDRSSPRFQDPSVRSEGIAFRTTADVAFTVALLSGATAVILLLTDVGKGSSDVTRAGGVLRW